MYAPCIGVQCTRQLFLPKRQLRRAGFISLGKLVRNDVGLEEVKRDTTAVDGDGVPKSSKSGRNFKRLTFAQSYQERQEPTGVDTVLETLFASTRAQGLTSPVSRYSRTPKDKPAQPDTSTIALDLRLLELHNKLRRGTAPLEDIWRGCEELLEAKIWTREDATPPMNGKESSAMNVFRDILLAICSKQRIMMKGPDGAVRIVTPADVIETFLKHGVMGYWWDQVLWSQLEQVVELKHKVTDGLPKDVSAERLQILLIEIRGVWTLFLRQYGSWTITLTLRHAKRSPKLSHRFLRLLPKHPIIHQVDRMAKAAETTWESLQAAEVSAPMPLMHFFKGLCQGNDRDQSIPAFSVPNLEVPLDNPEKIVSALKSSPSDPNTKVVQKRFNNFKRPVSSKGSDEAPEHGSNLDWTPNAFELRMAEIDGASKRLDSESAISLWESFRAHLTAGHPEDKETNDRIFARLLRTFWTLRRSDQAIVVWNYMVNAGRLPGQMHWTAMLTGCIRAKDVESLQRIWFNMLRSGLPPDTTVWTTYIHGLIDCRRMEEGLAALEQLGRIWKSAPAPKPADSRTVNREHKDAADMEPNKNDKPRHDIVLPSMTPVHAALSALVHIDRVDLIPTVMRWAKSQNLKLETYTFNIILRPLVRRGTQPQIQEHLQSMAQHGCTPDTVTFTIILNGLVSNPTSTFHALPAEAQENTIVSILADMARHNIPANTYTYSTLLDGLLNPNPKIPTATKPNIAAARTILVHMAQHNIRPSPHIYTILITHYFSLKPPDLPAIAALWASIHHSGQTKELDQIFFDRLIEGYADCDEIEKALQYLRRMPKDGKSPGWNALTRVLLALVRKAEWGLCAELVEDVKSEGGLLRFEKRIMRDRMKGEFWYLVDELRARGVLGRGDEEK